MTREQIGERYGAALVAALKASLEFNAARAAYRIGAADPVAWRKARARRAVASSRYRTALAEYQAALAEIEHNKGRQQSCE